MVWTETTRAQRAPLAMTALASLTLGWLACMGASPARADDATLTCSTTAVPIERQLRQLYLDLLGRPPTIDEYRAAKAKGSIDDTDLTALLGQDAFYARMQDYHRALLRSNVSASLPNNGDQRVTPAKDGQMPLESTGNISGALRGKNGIGCDHFIAQDDCKNASLQQDPQSEGAAASKVCRDPNGVPLPVSFDYDVSIYACTALTGATSCADAVTKNLLDAKLIYFCDMRRDAMSNLVPNLCVPDKSKPTQATLTDQVLDDQGKVIAFNNPKPAGTEAYTRLDRCTLGLTTKNGVVGTFAVQRGCIEREGYVMVDPPYWSGGTAKVAACAIEAQNRAVNPATMQSCETGGFLSDRSCGCGQNFRRCESGDQAVYKARVAAINEEPLLITDAVLRNEEDYFHILTTRVGFVNGVLSSYYRQNQGTGALAITAPLDPAAVPDVAYAQADQWVSYLRGEQASGVLTTPEWLYRFPTQRSRVSEFYGAFLCQSFVPPANAVSPDPEDSCNRENNLAKRCGCNYCHATIEPTGAYWGRFGERNALYLDPVKSPKFDANCRDCALAGDTNCNGTCSDYVMQAVDGDGANSLGMLKSYLYRTADDQANIEAGPSLLVQRMLQTGDLERCAVKRIWNEFLGRPMSAQEETMYLEQLVEDFIDAQHNLKSLIKRVVTSDAYKRID